MRTTFHRAVSRPRPVLRLGVAMSIALALFSGGSALAAEAPIEGARRIAKEGVQLYDGGHYEDALARFRAADEIYGAPQNKVYAARCLSKLGRLIEARQVYDAILDEVLREDVPTSFRDAQTVALSERGVLKKRIPTLSITVNPPDLAGLEILVDGAPVRSSDLPALSVDPGKHIVVVRRDPERATTAEVTVSEGERRSIELVAPVANVSVAGAPQGAGGGWIGPGLLLGLGGAALAAGAGAGIWSLLEVNDLKERCDPAGHCPAADASRGEAASAAGNASTALLVIGGASVAGGLIWLGVGQPWQGKKGVAIALGPGAVLLRGRFE